MLTVLVTNTKGGCGKTTLATNLAGAFAASGYRTVLADSDRQRSSLRWLERRPSARPRISGLDWRKEITPVPGGTQRLVIDVPGALGRKQVKAMVGHADIVVSPVLPSVFDEETTRRFIRDISRIGSIRKSKRALAIVGNRVRTRTRSAQQLDLFLEEFGQATVAWIRDSQLYATAAQEGLSIFDFGTKRAAGFKPDWRPLLALIDEVTGRVEG